MEESDLFYFDKRKGRKTVYLELITTNLLRMKLKGWWVESVMFPKMLCTLSPTICIVFFLPRRAPATDPILWIVSLGMVSWKPLWKVIYRLVCVSFIFFFAWFGKSSICYTILPSLFLYLSMDFYLYLSYSIFLSSVWSFFLIFLIY